MTSLRDAIENQIGLARETGQTHFVAYVEAVEGFDPLAIFESAGTRDRFYFEDLAAGECHVAVGTCDEIESAGKDRFEDVDAFRAGVAGRIVWAGDSRRASRPLLLGGFAFSDTPSSSPDWKSFPGARFVLPEMLWEQNAEGASRIRILRIERGASAEVIERQCEALARGSCTRTDRHPVESGAGPKVAGADPGVMARPIVDVAEFDGPEFRVRADRPHEAFEAQVRLALEAFEGRSADPQGTRGGLQKVVLARSLSIEHDGALEVVGFLGRLRALYPSCTVIAMGRGLDTFLAATPETLVQVEGRRVRTAALAGSAPRGRTPEEDSQLGAALLGSEKERAEHAHVVDAIRQVLAERCEVLSDSQPPSLRRLFGIQHLETLIEGELRKEPTQSEARGLMEIAAALHPTPAVGGAPKVAAIDWLSRFEGLDRGWYAAPIGWLDSEGGGDLRVALRSGLIRNGVDGADRFGAGRALLFAGAGIVEGSEPAQELVETRIKLRALLAPLTEI